MAKLPDDILNTIFTLQRRLVEVLNETTATEYIFMQQFGETEATLPELESLDNIKERLRTSYNRLYRLLQQVAESQPAATEDTLNFLYGTYLISFKSPILGRMKHLDIKHRVFISYCRPNASSLHY